MSAPNIVSDELKEEPEIQAFAVMEANGKLVDWSYRPLPVAEDEVELEVEACGVCHSDLNQQQNYWGNFVEFGCGSPYPGSTPVLRASPASSSLFNFFAWRVCDTSVLPLGGTYWLLFSSIVLFHVRCSLSLHILICLQQCPSWCF